jgi:hypothetical protein
MLPTTVELLRDILREPPPHEPESNTEPPHLGPLLHKCVEEREICDLFKK